MGGSKVHKGWVEWWFIGGSNATVPTLYSPSSLPLKKKGGGRERGWATRTPLLKGIVFVSALPITISKGLGVR
jgi:hypothetical protein